MKPAGVRTRYARSGDARIAYQVFGEGPIDVVLVPGVVSNVEHLWELPGVAAILDGWGDGALIEVFAPSFAGRPRIEPAAQGA